MPPAPSYVTTTRATAVPLLANETVIFRTRKHILFLLFPLTAVTAAGAALFLVLTSLQAFPLSLTALRFAVIGVILFIDLIIFLDWVTTIYLVTSRRVQYRFGIIGEQTKTIALEQITNTKTQIGIGGRIFNFGDIIIDAANNNSTIKFRRIGSPEARLDLINEAKLNRTP